MTKRTHDLAGVALASYWFLTHPPVSLTWETLFGMGVATFIGSIIPDIDNVASPAWKHSVLPYDDDLSRDFLQGHRKLSHSIIGIFLFLYIVHAILQFVSLPHVDTVLVMQAFVMGYLSHLIVDSMTIEGVPWLFPLPWNIGIPPFRFLRIKTGGWIEKLVVFPVILALTVWIYYVYRSQLTIFLQK